VIPVEVNCAASLCLRVAVFGVIVGIVLSIAFWARGV
jgi:hypothetical protein